MSTLDYSYDNISTRGRFAFWVAGAFCVITYLLLFIDMEIAAFPALTCAVASAIAYFRRRTVFPKTNRDVQIKCLFLLGVAGLAPMVWYSWTISGWANPKSAREADAMMDRGTTIFDACADYSSRNKNAFPTSLPLLIRRRLLAPNVISPRASISQTDSDLEHQSDFLYFGGDLDGTWVPSKHIIVLLSRESFKKYGGSGRVMVNADGQSLFCFDRDLADAINDCNHERAQHGLPPLPVQK